MITHFDHVYSHTLDSRLKEDLERFEKAGFLINPNFARHPAGHYNGFISLTRSYLELISIVDEDEFQRDAKPDDKYFRTRPQPFGIGALTETPEQIYKNLHSLYSNMQEPYSRGESGKENAPILWTFAPLPLKSTPGAYVFALKYHSTSTTPTKWIQRLGPNQVFALGGFYFCSEEIEKDFGTWKTTMQNSAYDFSFSNNHLDIGFQKLTWITPQQYRDLFEAEWIHHPVENGKIAAVKLLTRNLETSIEWLEKGGFQFLKKTEICAYFRKDKNTGYTFVLEQSDIDLS
jgi:hypothetical protein